ncbi:MAG TPA: DinB family protein [Candidatus Angelobacter sp.]|nr:DinB family protein [Candidatus Angelobacter sp.]
MNQPPTFLLLATLSFAAAAVGQSANGAPAASAAQAQPSPPPTVTSILDRDISGVEKQILDLAEAMPEDKFNFSPETLHIPGADYKGVRTFAAQLKHVAASNYAIWSPLTGDKIPEGLFNDGKGPENVKSKAEIVRFLKDSFALGHRAAAALTPENMLQNPEHSKSTRLRLASFGVAHAFDHYGQMVEYLRMNGIVPPASRSQSH